MNLGKDLFKKSPFYKNIVFFQGGKKLNVYLIPVENLLFYSRNFIKIFSSINQKSLFLHSTFHSEIINN